MFQVQKISRNNAELLCFFSAFREKKGVLHDFSSCDALFGPQQETARQPTGMGFGLRADRERRILQASGRGRGQERRANGAECSDGGHGLIRSRRTGGGTESDGCFPLFTPCRNAFLPVADSFAMEDPASCSEALPARSRAFRCREGVRLRSPLPARKLSVGARSWTRMPACPGERGPRRTRGTAQIPSRDRGQTRQRNAHAGHRAGGSSLNARGNILRKRLLRTARSFFQTTRRPPTKNAACFRRVGASLPVRRRPKAGGSGLCELFFLCRHGGGEAITQRLERIAAFSLSARKRHTAWQERTAFQRPLLCQAVATACLPSSPHTFPRAISPRHLPAPSPRAISPRRPAQGSAKLRGVHSPGRMFRKPERRNHARACHLVCGP